MRLAKKISSAVIACILFWGCSNNDPAPSLLVGNWLWEESSGGIAGMTSKPQPSERIILNFSSDGKFNVQKNDTLAYRGTFQVTTGQSIYSGKEELKIETEQIHTGLHPIIRQIVVVKGIVRNLSASQLSIGDNRHDGFGSSFRKQ